MTSKARTKLLVHPGEVLQQEFLNPMGMSASALARALDVPGNRITEIVAGRRSVTADSAIRLSRYFGTSVEFWTNMQTTYDLVRAEAENDYSKVRPRDAKRRVVTNATREQGP